MPCSLSTQFTKYRAPIAGLLALAMLLSANRWAESCPFCTAQAQTLSEEMESMDAVIIAKMVEPPTKPKGNDKEFAVPRATFQVVEVLKGDGVIKKDQKVVALFYSEPKPDAKYLIMGVDPTASPTSDSEADTKPKASSKDPLTWSTPIVIVPEVEDYLHQLPKLPKQGLERIAFFYKYLECPTELLARDSFDEFARTPYDTVKKLKAEMDKKQLWTWIRNPEIPTFRRRLYLTMLGICGDKSDVAELENLLKAEKRSDRTALDALVASYLTLKGEDGVALVEELFLKNPKAEYSDLYSTIMSLRVLSEEIKSVPQQRIIEAFRSVLERPDLADLVIPDLARYEDWDSLDRLVDLYRTADPKTTFVRVPVVNFVRACPLPKAEKALEELKKIDPDSVRKANSLFPFSPKSGDRNKPPQSSYYDGQESDPAILEKGSAEKDSNVVLAAATSEIKTDPTVGASATTVAAAEANSPSATSSSRRRTFAVNAGVAPAKALAKNSQNTPPNLWLVLGVPWGLGVACYLAQSWFLRGSSRS
jgi:hypothetical protein